MTLNYVNNNKGKNFLVADNFTFYREKLYKEKQFWRCTEYLKAKCMSRCHTKDEAITKRTTDHNHVADVAKWRLGRLLTTSKERAATSLDWTTSS